MEINIDLDKLYDMDKPDRVQYIVELLDELSLVVGESLIQKVCKFYVDDKFSSRSVSR